MEREHVWIRGHGIVRPEPIDHRVRAFMGHDVVRETGEHALTRKVCAGFVWVRGERSEQQREEVFVEVCVLAFEGMRIDTQALRTAPPKRSTEPALKALDRK